MEDEGGAARRARDASDKAILVGIPVGLDLGAILEAVTDRDLGSVVTGTFAALGVAMAFLASLRWPRLRPRRWTTVILVFVLGSSAIATAINPLQGEYTIG